MRRFLLLGSSAVLAASGGFWRPPVPGAPALQAVHGEVFQKFATDYLRLTFYADPVALKARPRGIGARAALLRGDVWCARRAVVLQEIGGARRAEGLRAQLRAHWPEGPFDEARPAVRRLLAFSSAPLEVGDHLDYVWVPGGRVHLRRGQGSWLVLSDPPLVRALLRIAFDNELDPGRQALDRALESAVPRP